MLVGGIVNAAGTAALEASDRNHAPTAEAGRSSAMTEHLARLGATSGDPQAAYVLATLLTERGDSRGLHWMCEAAQAGHGGAQLQLGHWYNQDREREDPWPFIGADPDDRVAAYWYGEASRNGKKIAVIFLDSLRDTEPTTIVTSATGDMPDCTDGIRLFGGRETIARGDPAHR